MEIRQVVPVLWIRCGCGSSKNHTCTIHKNVETPKLLGNRKPYVYQVLIRGQFCLDRKGLRRVLLSDSVQFSNISTDYGDAGPIVQVPVCQCPTNSTRSASDNDNLMQEITFLLYISRLDCLALAAHVSTAMHNSRLLKVSRKGRGARKASLGTILGSFKADRSGLSLPITRAKLRIFN